MIMAASSFLYLAMFLREMNAERIFWREACSSRKRIIFVSGTFKDSFRKSSKLSASATAPWRQDKVGEVYLLIPMTSAKIGGPFQALKSRELISTGVDNDPCNSRARGGRQFKRLVPIIKILRLYTTNLKKTHPVWEDIDLEVWWKWSTGRQFIHSPVGQEAWWIRSVLHPAWGVSINRKSMQPRGPANPIVVPST